MPNMAQSALKTVRRPCTVVTIDTVSIAIVTATTPAAAARLTSSAWEVAETVPVCG